MTTRVWAGLQARLTSPVDVVQIRLNGLLSSLFLVWAAMALYHFNGYYRGLLPYNLQRDLIQIAVFYTITSLLFYRFASGKLVTDSKSLLTVTALSKVIKGISSFVTAGPTPYTSPLAVPLTKIEKRALLFSLVKLFYIPLMLSFLVGNYSGFTGSLNSARAAGVPLFSVASFNNVLFPMLFNLVLCVDVTCFMFGYLFEASFLANKLRSVEPTMLGWMVALMCYPPFNGVVDNFVPWYANDFATGSTTDTTFWIRVTSLAFMTVYALASVALGTKASNLTNRGIVGHGPYRLVRHPAYICKNIAWWITILPVFNLPAVVGMSFWSFIYFMRAITEERHLSADPDYLAYCKKVRYRFIPGLI